MNSFEEEKKYFLNVETFLNDTINENIKENEISKAFNLDNIH